MVVAYKPRCASVAGASYSGGGRRDERDVGGLRLGRVATLSGRRFSV